jgi:hypothetical protein
MASIRTKEAAAAASGGSLSPTTSRPSRAKEQHVPAAAGLKKVGSASLGGLGSSSNREGLSVKVGAAAVSDEQDYSSEDEDLKVR